MSKTTSYGCSPGFAEYSFTTTGLRESSPRFRRTESRRERQQRRFEERLAIFHALATCADAPAEAVPDEASHLLSQEDLHKPESRSFGPSSPLDSFESHPLSSSLLQHHPRNGVAGGFNSVTSGRSGRRELCDLGHVAVALRDPAKAGESNECHDSPTAAKSPSSAERPLTAGGAGAPIPAEDLQWATFEAPQKTPSAERPLTAGGAGAPIPAEDLQWAWRLLVIGGHAPAFDSDSARTPDAHALPRPRGSGERGNERCVSATGRSGNAGERWGGLQGLAEKKAEEGAGGIEGGAGAERKAVGLCQVGGSRTWVVPSPRGDELQAVTAAQRRQRVRRSQWLLRWLQQQQEQQQLHQHQQQQLRPSCGSFKAESHAFPVSDAELRGDGAGDRGNAAHSGVSARLGRLSLSSASSGKRRPFRQLSPFEATSRDCAPLTERWERKQGDESRRRIAAPGDADESTDADADADADARRRVEGWFREYADTNISAGTVVADVSARRAERGDCANSVEEISACASPRPVPRKHFPSPLGRAWSAREAGERVLLRPPHACHAQCGGQSVGGSCEQSGPTLDPRYGHHDWSCQSDVYAPRSSHGHGIQRSVQRSRSLQERRGGVASRLDFSGWQDGVFPKRAASCGLPENLGGGVVTRRAGYTQAAAGGGGGSIFGETTLGDVRSSLGFDAGSQAPQKLYPGLDVKPKTPSHRHGSLSFSEWVGAKSSASANGLRTCGRGHQVGGSAGSKADVAPAAVTFAATTDMVSLAAGDAGGDAAGGATNVATPVEIIPSNQVVVTVDASDVTAASAAPDVTAAPAAPDVTADATNVAAVPHDTHVTVASTTTPTAAVAYTEHVTAAPTTTDIKVAVCTADVTAASDTKDARAAVNNGSTATGASGVQATRRDVTEDVTSVCMQPSGAAFFSLLPASEACQPICGEIVLAEPRSESAQESHEAGRPFCRGSVPAEPRNLMPDEEQGRPSSESAQESPEAGQPFCQGSNSVEPRVLQSGEEQGKPWEVPEGLRHGEEQGKDHHSRCPSFSLWVSPTPRLPPPSSPAVSPLFTACNVFSHPTVFTPLTTPSHPLDSSPRPLTNTSFFGSDLLTAT